MQGIEKQLARASRRGEAGGERGAGQEPRKKPVAGAAEVTVSIMQVSDIRQVVEIERTAFPTPWSERAFQSELTENLCACYIVARLGDDVVGYGGMWVMMDEAHVTNIAVRPEYRGQGIGGRLLMELMAQARMRGASRMTLEVRRSNRIAQNLYEKFGFLAKGIRRGYYSDTREDAIVMWRENL